MNNHKQEINNIHDTKQGDTTRTEDTCTICKSTDNLQVHPSFGKLLCANCYRIANDNIP